MIGGKKIEDINIPGDHSKVVGGDDNSVTNIYSDNEKREQGILEEIFNYVINKVKDNSKRNKKSDKLIHTKEKIELNFEGEAERQEVKEYFTHSYHKIILIESYFELLSAEDQNDIHSYSYLRYQELKGKLDSPINILRELFKIFLPDGKEKNPMYINLANALVLFFFDDCTIFEKTAHEKDDHKTIFDEL